MYQTEVDLFLAGFRHLVPLCEAAELEAGLSGSKWTRLTCSSSFEGSPHLWSHKGQLRSSVAFWQILDDVDGGGLRSSARELCLSTNFPLIKVSYFQNVLLGSSSGPKYQLKNLTFSALEFEKWSNHKIKALYNVFNTLKSPYHHM